MILSLLTSNEFKTTHNICVKKYIIKIRNRLYIMDLCRPGKNYNIKYENRKGEI